MKHFKISEEFQKIFKFNPKNNKLIARESGTIEFKESFNWNSKSKYAKSIAAFSNNKGGYIIFGVADKPRAIIGLQNNNFESLDEAKISEYLNGTFSPEIYFEKFTVNIKNKEVGVLRVIKCVNKPVICIKTDNDVREGEMYYRYNARSEKIKYPELTNLIDEIRMKEKKSWMDHFQKIARIGISNIGVLDTFNGKIEGDMGTLVIDEKLIPKLRFINEGTFKEGGRATLKLIGDVRPVSVVAHKILEDQRITDNPNAPEVRLSEEDFLKKYPYSYKKLVDLFKKRYKNFAINSAFHELKKNLERFPKYCLTRRLDPKNPRSAAQKFYSEEVVRMFDTRYIKSNK